MAYEEAIKMSQYPDDELIEFNTPPSTSGWYGIINSADDGDGMIDIWGDAEYWDSISGIWRENLVCASYRSSKPFQSRIEALEGARENC
jgi:hypothetical protein